MKSSPLIQRIVPRLYEGVEARVLAAFYEIIFRSVAEIIAKYSKQFANAGEVLNEAGGGALRAALRSGRVLYANGTFSGSFSAAIGRELRALGATFDKSAEVFNLAFSLVPDWVRTESVVHYSRAIAAHAEIKKSLGYQIDFLDDLIDKNTVSGEDVAEDAIDWWHKASHSIEVAPQLGPDAARKFAADYTENMKLWIKKFSREKIEEVRALTEENATQGYRFDRLADKLENRFDVSRSKAKFLARQETALFMSKFREQRFTEAGYDEYTWQTTHDARVRPDHALLDGKTFKYTAPPVVDRKTGRRANAGEDYGCRCVARPVITKTRSVQIT